MFHIYISFEFYLHLLAEQPSRPSPRERKVVKNPGPDSNRACHTLELASNMVFGRQLRPHVPGAPLPQFCFAKCAGFNDAFIMCTGKGSLPPFPKTQSLT